MNLSSNKVKLVFLLNYNIQKKKNYFILDSSENNSHLEKKIFDITSRYLKIK